MLVCNMHIKIAIGVHSLPKIDGRTDSARCMGV